MIYNSLQAQQLYNEALQTIQQDFQNPSIKSEDYTDHFFILTDFYFFKAVSAFEKQFPMGRKVRKTRYIQHHLQNIEYFF